MPRPATAAAVVLAGGHGSRIGASRNKVYLPLAGRRIISWSLAAMAHQRDVGPLVLVVRPDDRALAREVVRRELPHRRVDLVDGGATRHDSEHAALQHLAPDIASGAIDVVLIHDGARPLVPPRLVAAVLAAAREHGGALPGLDLDDALHLDSVGAQRPDRTVHELVRVQTPQAFRAGPLLDAYEKAHRHDFRGTDTSACVEMFCDLDVVCVPGDPCNIKVTYPQDLFLAEQLLAGWGYRLPA